jgi:cytoskeleton protein RodZ
MTDEQAVMETPLNQRFIEAREAKGLSKEDAYRQLSLSPAQLDKLESEGLDPSKLTFFERGYIRNYAALLGMKPAEYEPFLPQSSELNNQLHSVKRYSVSVDKPLMGNFLIKILFFIFIVVGIGFLILSTQSSSTQIQSPTENVNLQQDISEQLELPK